MNNKILLLLALGLVLMGCPKKAPPVTDPKTTDNNADQPGNINTSKPVGTTGSAKTGPSAEDLLGKRIEELLKKVLGNTIYFDYDQASLTQEAKEILSEVGTLLQSPEGKAISIVIEGHTDEVGSDEYNLALGERRAQMVMQYLESYGIAQGRISIVSYGEEKPVVSTGGIEAKNRRAQFEVKINR